MTSAMGVMSECSCVSQLNCSTFWKLYLIRCNFFKLNACLYYLSFKINLEEPGGGFPFSPPKISIKTLYLYVCNSYTTNQSFPPHDFHFSISPPKIEMSPRLFHKVHSTRDAFFICHAIRKNDHKRLVMSHNVLLKGINDNLNNFTLL